MTVFIGADHRGFELKNKLMEYLQEKNIRVEDMGNYSYEAEDDYPVFAKKVAHAVLQNPSEFLGIVVCGSGIGVSMAANRVRGVRCGQCLTAKQAQHGRANDHINVLSIASDMTLYADAQKIVDAFLSTKPNEGDKYTRRVRQLDEG